MKFKSSAVRRRLRRIQALVLDVDGVLTDGGMYYSVRGEEMKRFHTQDGMGLAMLREAGFKLGFITAEASEIALRRAEKLKITDVYLGANDKLEALSGFLRKHGLRFGQVAYAGDDLNDLPCLRAAGLAVTVPGAAWPVVKAAHAVTSRRGGEGAVREIADLLLRYAAAGRRRS